MTSILNIISPNIFLQGITSQSLTVTLAIIIITALVSIAAFNNQTLMYRLNLNPYMVVHRNQWYRVLSHGFVHADWIHLFVNMFVLFSFGRAVERYFQVAEYEGFLTNPILHFLLIYFLGMFISTVVTVGKHKDNYQYNAVGASGAVSAIVFASIFFNPTSTLLLFAVIPMPAFVFGILFLAYSQYMQRRGGDNVNHNAHFIGAVFGFIYPLLINPEMIKIYFLNQLF